GASGFALVKIDHIGNEVREVAQQDLPVTRILSQITVHQFELAIVFERALRFGAGDNNLALSEQIKTLLNSFQRISREVEHEIDRGRGVVADGLKRSQVAREVEELKKIKVWLGVIHEQHEVYEKLALNIFHLLLTGQREKAQGLFDTIGEKQDSLDTELEKILGEIESFSEESVRLAVTHEERAFSGAATIFIVSWFIAGLLAILFTRSITKPLSALISVLTRAADSGDFSQRVEVRGHNELSKLSKIFNQMAQNAQDQAWLKSASDTISKTLQEARTPEELAESLVSKLGGLLDCGFGVFYILNEKRERYELLGSYRFKERKHMENSYASGEGLVGQCVREGKPMLLTHVPNDYTPIHSGLGEATPNTVMALPVIFQDRVLAVLEIASFQKFTPIQQALVEGQMATIGMGLENLMRNLRTEALLQKTQIQAEELTTQSEELQLTNEELEVQALELKKSQEELRAQQLILEQANESLELARSDVEKKARALEISSGHKTQFIANMSHELRTPLNSVLILAREFMENEEGNLSQEQTESAKIIHDSGSDLLNLINDILDLSKIESGTSEVYLTDVEVRPFVERLHAQFKHLASEKGFNWQVDVEAQVPKIIQTDQGKLGQIIKNFLSNAFKFTSEGDVSMFWRLSEDSREDQLRLAIDVADSGVGIPDEKRAHIFGAFQQADGSISRRYGGAGLGLAISRELAHMLGGEIQLKSEEGEGSIFTLFLPVSQKEMDDSGSSDQSSHHSGGASDPSNGGSKGSDMIQGRRSVFGGNGHRPNGFGGNGHHNGFKGQKPSAVSIGSASEYSEKKIDNDSAGETTHLKKISRHTPIVVDRFIDDDRLHLKAGDRTLLVIEDDPVFARAVRDFARKNGFKCLAASHGQLGIQMACQYKPEGIILDLGLPDMDGKEVLKQLKRHKESQSIPTHVISARDVEPQHAQGLTRDAISVLQKPVTPLQLEEVLNDVACRSKEMGAKLLLVEGDAVVRRTTSALLEKHHIEVAVAEDCETAMQLLRREVFKCLILDLELPHCSGFDLLESMAGLPELKAPQVIIHSGRALSDQDIRRLGSYSGMVATRKKHPRAIKRLVTEVASFLKNMDHTRLPERADDDLTRWKTLFQGVSVLLVDDDMRNTYALSRALEKRGLKVIMAPDGQTALDLLDKNSNLIDAVLMDIMMPGMDGHETMRRIRKRDNLKDLPIIALSAKAMVEDQEQCFHSGASAFLPKPVDLDQLPTLLKDFVTSEH
ncbi:response regulator, partial [Magnetococcales bacterium HHB-1]